MWGMSRAGALAYRRAMPHKLLGRPVLLPLLYHLLDAAR